MVIKRFIYFAAFMLLSLPIALAQSTTVNGTIVDPAGNIWANAVVTAQFQQAPNTPGPYTWSGGAYNPLPAPVVADATGAFSITLPSNTAIVPSNSTWQFSVAPNATLPAAIVNVSLSGGTLNLIPIITAFSAWPTGNIPGTFINKAYNTTQVGTVPLNVGAMIYNTTLKQLQFWNGTVWALIGSGGGGGGSPAGNGVSQFSNAAGNNFISGAVLDTDAFGGSVATQTAGCTTVCDIFTPANSTNGEPGESLAIRVGKISSMWTDHRGNKNAEYFTNPQPSPSFPTFSTLQAARGWNLIYTEPNPTSTAGTQQGNVESISMYMAPGFSNGNAGCPLFCPPAGYVSMVPWTIMNEYEDLVTFNSAGISDLRAVTCVFAGIGDHQCGLGGEFIRYDGGFIAPADEGLYGAGSLHLYTGGDWQGQLTILTDANHIKTTQLANQGEQGQGRFMLDFTNIPKDAGGVSLGTNVPVDLSTGPFGTAAPGFLTINSVTLPASTAVGITTNDCTVPTQFGGVAIGQNSLVNGCQITVSSGAFVAGNSPVCMAYFQGNLFNIGMQMVSPPTALSGGHQTIFATMHRSIPAGSFVYQGGGCSWGVALKGDDKGGQTQNNSVTFGSVIPIIGSEAHKLFYAVYSSSQHWTTLPLPGSQWGTRDTGNSPGAKGFLFATLTRVGGLVTGVTGTGGQASPPLWEMLRNTKFFSVSGCTEPTMNSTGVNSFIGMPGPEPGRVTYGLAGPDNVCTNAIISMQNTTVAPVFLSEVYDVANHTPGLAPFNIVDGTFAISYQPGFLVNDILDSPTHYAAAVTGLRITDQIAQPMFQNTGLWLSNVNVASYTGQAILIDNSAVFNELWGSGGAGYPETAINITGYVGTIINSQYAPAPHATLLKMGFAAPSVSDPVAVNSSFRTYDIWGLNNAGSPQTSLSFGMDNQTYCWRFNFSSSCSLFMDPSRSIQTTPAEFVNLQYMLNFNGTFLPITQMSECSPINANGAAPTCYNPIITNNAVITQSGTPGTTQYQYALAVNDDAGLSWSKLIVTFTGNATLSGTNFNNIPCTDLPAGKTGTIYVFPNPVMASVGTCASSATVVIDNGSRGPSLDHSPLIDGGIFDSGGFRAQGTQGMYAFSAPFGTASPATTITASISQSSAGIMSMNAGTKNDAQGSLNLKNIVISGTCTVGGSPCSAGGGGIANVSFALPTGSIAANTCTSTGTVTMTGLVTTSTFTEAFATDPSAANGWGANGGIVFVAWPTANTLNWRVCNQTTGAVVPGAMTINVGAK